MEHHHDVEPQNLAERGTVREEYQRAERTKQRKAARRTVSYKGRNAEDA